MKETRAEPSGRDANGLRRRQPYNEPLPSTMRWAAALPRELRPFALLRRYPRIANLLARDWNDLAECQRYFDELLEDRRGRRMAIAPAGFGRFSNHLLVGNNGDGRINAYDLKNFSFDGQLGIPNGRLLTIDGLWGLSFGNGFQHQPTDTLFFTAGPNEETNGLFGTIEAQ